MQTHSIELPQFIDFCVLSNTVSSGEKNNMLMVFLTINFIALPFQMLLYPALFLFLGLD
jgi:hypothetical protein